MPTAEAGWSMVRRGDANGGWGCRRFLAMSLADEQTIRLRTRRSKSGMVPAMINRATIVLSFVVVLIAGGCHQGTTQQGTLYHVSLTRELTAYLSADLQAVHTTALAVVEESGYAVENSAIDVREGVINARTARDHAVRVETYKQGDHVTKIEVYVAGQSSEAASRDILDKIEARLK